MTIAPAARAAAMRRVLTLLADLSADSLSPRLGQSLRFGETDFGKAEPFPTTIQELEDAGLIKQVAFSSDPKPYVLTVEGWFQAHRVSGRFDSEEFQERRGRLCSAMKLAVNSRHDMAVLDYADLAGRADVAADWLWNLLTSEGLKRLDPKRRYQVRFEDGNVYVPTTFGQEPAELD